MKVGIVGEIHPSGYEIFDKNPKINPAKSEIRKISKFSMFPNKLKVSSSFIGPPARKGTVIFPISPVILGEAVELAYAISLKEIQTKSKVKS